MKNFNFLASTKILFGKDKVREIGDEIVQHGKSVLLTYGQNSIKKSGLYDQVIKELSDAGIKWVELSGILPNPRVSSVREGVKLCRENDVDFILAVGGGSVVDCSKAIAAAVAYEGDPWDFYTYKTKVSNPIPIGTILTLAATGSEMNGNSVLSNEETLDKKAIGDDALRPCFSVLDPTLTFSVNRWQSAAGAVDVMSHVFEQYFSADEDVFLQNAICEGILETCIKYGPVVIDEPENYEARANILWASSLALNGMVSTGRESGDWATHMMEHEVSAIYDLTHGAGLAIIFPNWMTYVLNSDNAHKFARYARRVWGIVEDDDMKAAQQGIATTRHFFTSLGMPSTLKEVEIPGDHIKVMAQKACTYGAIGHLKKLEPQDVEKILTMCL